MRELLGHVKERGERRVNKMFYNLIIHIDFIMFPYALGNIVDAI
jgi:hypothetical protein